MATRPDSELACVTKAKDLIGYIFAISENAPKKFRFSLISKMQNLSLEIMENMILANEVMLGIANEDNQKRRNYQHMALAKLRILDSVILIALQQKCILPKQYTVISKLISDCINLTGAWINSDLRRIK